MVLKKESTIIIIMKVHGLLLKLFIEKMITVQTTMIDTNPILISKNPKRNNPQIYNDKL